MRHRKKGSKLNRSRAHRKALLSNLATEVIQHDRIQTTAAKAREVRPLVEKLVTLAKSGTLHARRRALLVVKDRTVVKKLMGKHKVGECTASYFLTVFRKDPELAEKVVKRKATLRSAYARIRAMGLVCERGNRSDVANATALFTPLHLLVDMIHCAVGIQSKGDITERDLEWIKDMVEGAGGLRWCLTSDDWYWIMEERILPFLEAKTFERTTRHAAGMVGRSGDMTKGMTLRSGELARSTAELNRIASEGGQVVKEVNSYSRDTSQAVLENAAIIRDLGSRSEEIGAVVEVIESIADETNLLALNAAIIAAQAGEHGRSFAVVADEIRELAERTSSSTKEVADLVKGVQDGIGRATRSIEQSAEKVQQSANLAEQAGVIWENVRSTSEKNVKLADSITLSCSEQSQGSDSLVEAVESVLGAVERVGAKVRDQRGIQGRTSTELSSLRALADDWEAAAGRATELAHLLDEETHSTGILLHRITDFCTQGNQLAGEVRGRIKVSRDLALRQIEVLHEQGGVLRSSEADGASWKGPMPDGRAFMAEVACE